ncbi:hypothetical protein [Actinomycetospora sp. TBRC 11914]|uniref:hypothetical protein n=1 Tax=Actinomycetospora sp. TBRC 11914 TaxID=2729387 RepID=UPI00145FC1CB|nr:hypothetical protein [Actinomycetospora sp. TBRC 11914]NMO89731.1 hypothetical protein [Actinomycetospora sp. TBRC 11914]
MGRRGWVRTAAAVAGATVALLAAACSSDPPPPGEQHTIQFTATSSAAGTAFGRYVTVGQLGSNQEITFAAVPFDRTMPVGYSPQPKMQVSLVGVPPNSRLTCRISVDGQVVATQTVSAPGQDAVCAAP